TSHTPHAPAHRPSFSILYNRRSWWPILPYCWRSFIWPPSRRGKAWDYQRGSRCCSHRRKSASPPVVIGGMAGKAPEWTNMTNLASATFGGTVDFATDEWFGEAARLLLPGEPIFNDEFTEFGKWMDGWESRRKRVAGHDWCIIKLGLPGRIRGVKVDTAFFTGNQ
ncbi:unnamed protein product, partial [Ectocarpus sp. 12 AP-2014]